MQQKVEIVQQIASVVINTYLRCRAKQTHYSFPRSALPSASLESSSLVLVFNIMSSYSPSVGIKSQRKKVETNCVRSVNTRG